MDTRPIGMFDSGVGGLTVFKEIKEKFPEEKIIYLGDTKSFPYGSKSKESIINLAKKGIEFLIKKDVKAIIIACGTATSQALDVVKELYDIPIIGIIEPTCQYIASDEKIKKVGVVATAGTIRSNAWETNLKKLKSDLQVINKPCPLLAPMAEEGWTDNKIAELAVHEYMKGMHDVDALILGCTHYPLFENIFKKEVKEDCKIINTGKIIAENFEKYIEKGNDDKMKVETTEEKYQIYLTDTECNFINVAKKLLKDEECLNIKLAE